MKKRRRQRVLERGKHQVPSRVEVVDDEHQLGGPGLAEALADHLDVASTQLATIGRVRAAGGRPAPQRLGEMRDGLARVERRAERHPPRSPGHSPPPLTADAQHVLAGEEQRGSQHREHGDARNHLREQRVVEGRGDGVDEESRDAAIAVQPAQLHGVGERIQQGGADLHEHRDGEDGEAGGERPRHHAPRQPPPVQVGSGRAPLQAPDACQSRVPPSSAASIALATPMPRPATRSTLTPASASAFITPA